MRYRLEVRLTAADVGKRVVIRWRRPGPDDGEQIADVLGILEEHDGHSFAVRTRDGRLVVIPTGRALAGKWCHPARPPAPCRPPASLTGGSADAAWPPSRCPPKPAHPARDYAHQPGTSPPR
jgi:hypothetical protein